ncbi:sensor histidine kinase [Xanthocytophaga flava]|uniref:sensor histidine kinase n=1 Tax=Xanthocytophaga flava TaxID=3048013 RepID=UPI0028D211A5|nr:histidine kinase [Xanthocytophaga flavus]MDJ1469831.1 histidine kinase [Xanthocytophaga flavus]
MYTLLNLQLHTIFSPVFMGYRIEPLYDKWLRMFGLPLAPIPVHIYKFSSMYPTNWILGIKLYLTAVILLIAAWEIARIWLIYIRKNYSEIAQTLPRIIYTFSGYIIIGFLVRLVGFELVKELEIAPVAFLGCDTSEQFPVCYLFFISGIAYNCILGIIYEFIYYFHLYGIALQEAETLQRSNLQTQFDSLKSQINPHFLFNSLNSLSSLIREQPEQAEKFLDEMSNVYRYLLRNNEQELVSLQTELQFVESYFHLLKTRYGESIQLKLENLNGYEQYLLPPLTLQILLENAVKHNSILKEQPLVIQIYVEKGYLVVQNNVQKKNLKVASNKVGLHNIITKYQLLKQPDVKITESKNIFEVMIPLIESQFTTIHS